MGDLQGDVSVLSFPDLLQHLANGRLQGVLSVRQGSAQKGIYVSPEGMRLISSSSLKTASLGETLIRTRKISRVQLDHLQAEHKKTGRRLAELVNRLGTVTRGDIDAALRQQAQEEIYDLFTWTGARFEFREGPLPALPKDFPLAEILVDSSPTSAMLEAARRADEMAVIRKVLRDETMVPIRTSKAFTPEQMGLDPDLLVSVYSQINGRIGVSEVVRLSLYPRFEALRALYILATKGYLKIFDREGATVVHLRHERSKAAAKAVQPDSTTGIAIEGIPRSILLLGEMLKYRQALAGLLRDDGFEVIENVTAQAMNLLAGDRRVDAIVLDVGLGKADPFQIVTWLSENTSTPIVVLSADASKKAALAAVQRGARAYVVKPFTREAILRTVNGLFQHSSASVRSADGKK